jgi:hypothetical protein
MSSPITSSLTYPEAFLATFSSSSASASNPPIDIFKQIKPDLLKLINREQLAFDPLYGMVRLGVLHQTYLIASEKLTAGDPKPAVYFYIEDGKMYIKESAITNLYASTSDENLLTLRRHIVKALKWFYPNTAELRTIFEFTIKGLEALKERETEAIALDDLPASISELIPIGARSVATTIRGRCLQEDILLIRSVLDAKTQKIAEAIINQEDRELFRLQDLNLTGNDDTIETRYAFKMLNRWNVDLIKMISTLFSSHSLNNQVLRDTIRKMLTQIPQEFDEFSQKLREDTVKKLAFPVVIEASAAKASSPEVAKTIPSIKSSSPLDHVEQEEEEYIEEEEEEPIAEEAEIEEDLDPSPRPRANRFSSNRKGF